MTDSPNHSTIAVSSFEDSTLNQIDENLSETPGVNKKFNPSDKKGSNFGTLLEVSPSLKAPLEKKELTTLIGSEFNETLLDAFQKFIAVMASKTNHVGTFQPSVSSESSISQQAPANVLKPLISELVHNLRHYSHDGTVETVISLKNIQGFKGASLRVTTLEQAPGEMNLSFSNLSQEAKTLMEVKVNQQFLREILSEKGFKVQMFSASTEPEFDIKAPVLRDIPQKEHDPKKGHQEHSKQKNKREQERRALQVLDT